MSDHERLDRTLAGAFRELARTRGACPSRETLEAYREGTLDAAAAHAVEAHLVRCVECDLAIDRMERFDGAVHDQPGVRAKLEAGSARYSWWSGRWTFGLAGALASAAVCMLTIPRSNPPARIEGPRLAQFVAMSQERAPAAPLRIHRTGEDVVVLSFFVPMNPRLRYAAMIETADGRSATAPADVSRASGTGDVNLAIAADSLPVGQYRVRVMEDSTEIESIPFEVTH